MHTKGDANAVEDPWTLRMESRTTPLVITTLPLAALPIAPLDPLVIIGFFFGSVAILSGPRWIRRLTQTKQLVG